MLSKNACCSKLFLLCSFVDLNDFVIYATGGTLYTKSLASADGGSHDELTIPISRTGSDAVSAVTFDYNSSCVYWVDTTINAIQVYATQMSTLLVSSKEKEKFAIKHTHTVADTCTHTLESVIKGT